MAFEQVRYRPLASRVLAAVTVVVCAIGVVSLVALDVMDAVRYGWGLALVAVLVWAMFWRPELIVEEHGITVVNVFRTEFVPWPAIVLVDTQWALTLRTSDRVVRVWASPAPGRHRLLGLSRSDFQGLGDTARGAHGSLRPSDALSVPSGNLAQLIRGRWERLAETGALAAGAEPGATRTDWHTTTIIVTAALAAATVIGIVL
ncbi:PH domain-containing protein [Microbacterium dauci]|uniref:PH domain-containing protein n=1 Tax=Microbacterium dauci TaxID=3048008 RepID=A0ABT6ZC02_9MICO|nr:PH domain-containing protein [Microbacterium sp. LX3-4]MDJ1113473.1 PH domain-containing protein [Microbacterium sp. LX3-4]